MRTLPPGVSDLVAVVSDRLDDARRASLSTLHADLDGGAASGLQPDHVRYEAMKAAGLMPGVRRACQDGPG